MKAKEYAEPVKMTKRLKKLARQQKVRVPKSLDRRMRKLFKGKED